MVNSFIPAFEKHFQQLNKELETHVVVGDTFNFNEYSVQTAMKVIFETNFGGEVIDPELTHELFEGYLDNVARRILTPLLHMDFIYRFSKQYKEDTYFLNKFNEIFSRIAKKRSEKNLNNGSIEGRGLFIDELLKHTKGEELNFENQVLIENMATVFMAGYDTTALTISNVCLMLAMHPEIDGKLEEELFEDYKPGDVIDNELLKRLTYLDKVVKETLRLYPSAPFALRSNMKDVHLGKSSY